MAFFLLATASAWRGASARADVRTDFEEISVLRYEDVREEGALVSTRTDLGDQSSEANLDGGDGEKESAVSLSDAIDLAVPFTSQAPEEDWNQPWQDACEEAVILMLDAYYKGYDLSPLFAKDELVKMVDWEEGVRGWGRSIEIEKIQKTYEWFAGANALPMAIVEDPTVEDLKAFLAAGHPVLVVADGKVLPNPHFRSGGPEYHALVIRGYTEDSFITNDPGTKFGEQFLYTYNDLMEAIRDWNGGDVKHGRRVVLVAK